MKILYVNHYAGSPRHGMEYRTYYLSREWINAGHEVEVVAASFSHVRTVQPDMDHKTIFEEQIDGISYRWYATPSYRGNGVRRGINIIIFLLALWSGAKML